ncbi:putative glucan endo-1,3-beta-glucosidase eglC [Elsinoe ampelina]|uniref:Probable glucan endo-1,3-beta-glucosidase eglC n=1 Tax=Elsinoe ampelina TaxID=302913 RepID=A0A6A6FY75_9PEZI|nr:putative glucan endo-1,3-beta-glucosidase eglC [Elsinoe ampelina]
MRFSTTTTLLSLLSTATAYYTGFNVPANNPDGSCRSQADWERAFRTQRATPQGFATVRLFASSDCNTLANAVPAALATQTYILAGVWATDAGHFDAEKQALLAAIQQHGYGWLIGVSVGSEDLYRAQYQGTNEIQPWELAQKIYDVRGMLTTVGIGPDQNIPVGHVDTWTSWVDGRNEDVIKACDFVGHDGYPYWQDTAVQDAPAVFWDAVNKVRDVVNRVKPGTWVWITETGWAVSGQTNGAAVASVDNLQRYWKEVACVAFNSAHTFWYALEDWNQSPSFGVIGADGRPLIDFSC